MGWEVGTPQEMDELIGKKGTLGFCQAGPWRLRDAQKNEWECFGSSRIIDLLIFWKVNVKVLSFFLLKKSISTPGWMDTVYKYIER